MRGVNRVGGGFVPLLLNRVTRGKRGERENEMKYDGEMYEIWNCIHYNIGKFIHVVNSSYCTR